MNWLGPLLDRYRDDYLVPQGRELRVATHRLNRLRQLDPPTTEKVEQFLRSLPSPASRNRYRALLSHFVKWVNEHSLSDEVSFPAWLLKKERESSARTRRLMGDEEQKLRALMSPELETLFTLALDTGLRKGTLVQLRWKDVDFKFIHVRAEIQKHKESQTIPLTTRVHHALVLKARREAMEYGKSAYRIFPLPLAIYDEEWQNVKRKVGVEDFHWHDLRGEFASRLSEKGVPVEIISRLLGHSSLTMTQKYLRPRIGQFEDAIRKLEE